MIVNSVNVGLCSVFDRGLQFGDGLFETMLCLDGAPNNFEQHWERLSNGCVRLGIGCPDVRMEVLAAVRDWGRQRAVAKLIVTRGSSERGYRCAKDVAPNWVLTIGDAPNISKAFYEAGVSVRICRTRLSVEDEQLAGLKHLNRLPQVLARREWEDEYHDGLMMNHLGHVVEGCSSNLFLVSGGTLRTPDLNACGVRGIVRQIVLDYATRVGIPCEVTSTVAGDVEQADEVFLTNSVYGVLPVRAVDARKYAIGGTTRRILSELCSGVYFEK
ncbi:aminodeoxychorismate lyase [Sorangium sp. So ce131]|uniref:aminodeoxychorismate lyase n=1 Tax=Sorangium sp. So ce131 TaxID=3133282 RepID=UPI003F625B48